MKINWELEDTKRFLESKGYELTNTLGSINFTCYVYQNQRGINGKHRIEIWDDRSGDLHVVDINNRSVNLNQL